ncbi:MAG: AmmeMemoRadiSam system protein B [Phycisphaerae bacterium]
MLVREPVAAGGFYPAGKDECLRMIRSLPAVELPADLPERPVAGIVPHAGWIFSGATALAVLKAIQSKRSAKTFVLFGAVHRPIGRSAVFASGAWRTPLGLAAVDERLAREVLALAGDLLEDNPRAHVGEHSIEVQVPLIQHLFPDAKIVPIAVLPEPAATEIGLAVARAIRNSGCDAVCLGSTDLTHYGPAYGFTPRGYGEKAIQWVRDENDRRMIDLALRLDAEAAVPEAESRANACGSGAVAATLAAARQLGAKRGCLVHYTTSYDVMREQMGERDSDAAVGYAGLIF